MLMRLFPALFVVGLVAAFVGSGIFFLSQFSRGNGEEAQPYPPVVEPCTPVEGSTVDPCAQTDPPSGFIAASGGIVDAEAPATMRDLLDDEPEGAWPVHLVVRATYLPDTHRCTAGDHFDPPPHIDGDFGDTTDTYSYKCYADVRANEYIVGNGPAKLSVQFFRWLYFDAEDEEFVTYFDGSGSTPEDDRLFLESAISQLFAGRELILFIGPWPNMSTEEWAVLGYFDVQRQDDGTILAIQTNRDEWRDERPDVYATHRSRLEMTLPDFKTAATAADQARRTAYGGRIGANANFPMLRTNANQLTQYYADIGAYADPDNPPNKAPLPYVLPPSSVTATPDGVGQATITWPLETAADFHAVQHKPPGATKWTTIEDRVSGNTTTATNLLCGQTHEFRVGGYESEPNTTYNTRVGFWTETSVDIPACPGQPPTFPDQGYAFHVSIAGLQGDAIGAVLAYDLNADPLTYSITAGNEAGKFAIVSNTGAITLSERLRVAAGTVYTLTVAAADGVTGGATTTATVTVVEPDCSTAEAVNDCEVLLNLRDTLAGTASLNWHETRPMAEWEGITLGGSPQRVTEIVLDRKKLTGAIPPELAALSRLENLRLSHNQLTRGIPPELGTLEALMQLWLNDNSLSGTIPAELGEPEDLEVVYLGGNSLQGCMPGTLGDARVNDFHRLNLPACAMERPAAPSGLAASLSWGTFTLTWTGVAGAGAYEAQHRAPGQSSWTALPTVMSTSATYTPEEAPPCDTTYGFRVRARGDGLTHPTYWGQPSDVQTYTTGSCNLPPEFDPETYTFSIADSAATGSAVGTVLATDPDTGDTLTYSITGGNEDDKFAIGESTGAVTVKAALAYAAAASYTLTVQADDGKGGTDTATVGVSLTLAACSNGTVVPRPAQNPRLVRDCSILLTAKDTLAGDGALNWSANLAMNRWTGAAVEREQDLYLRFLMLTDAGLTGTIPASFAGLKDLTRLDLDQNDLTGGIPAELGDMTNLDQLYLQDNRLSGNIPDELANLTHLRYLHLYDNRLTGSMPARLGELNALKELLLDDNRLTGAIPAEVGDMEGLRILFLRNNQFSGAIPAALEHLSNLTQLYLEGNGFTGCIPAGLQDVENNDLDLLGLTDCTT